MNNGGDVLARGGVRATFQPAQVSQDKWDSIFGADSGPAKRGSDASGVPTGNAGVKPRKSRKRSTK
jgi:hypothetical protein